MKTVQIMLATMALLFSVHVEGQKPEVPSVDAAACAASPLLAELSKPPAAALLRSYGYNLREPWACTKISSPWAAGSTLLHFRKVTAQTDDTTAFSVMKTAGIPYLWIVPTDTGMLEVRNAESDPHNIAAFNALLRSLSKEPSSSADWNGIGKLYLALLGRGEAVPIAVEAASPSPCNSDGECSLEFSEVPRHGTDPYTKLTLTFEAPKGAKPATLTDVAREIVKPSDI